MQKGIIVHHGTKCGHAAAQADGQELAEGRAPAKPSLWDHALRLVRGEGTAELVERFTQEMTLVAEGICEDQARLRRAVDVLKQQAEEVQGQTAQDMQCWQRRFDEQSLRIAELESSLQRLQGRSTWRSLLTGDGLGRAVLLSGIICATVLCITVLKLLA